MRAGRAGCAHGIERGRGRSGPAWQSGPDDVPPEAGADTKRRAKHTVTEGDDERPERQPIETISVTRRRRKTQR